jgi:carbon storage regulator
MLVLSRKAGEQILIGPNITIQIVRLGPNSVKIGIEAPKEIQILRPELQTADGKWPMANGQKKGGK